MSSEYTKEEKINLEKIKSLADSEGGKYLAEIQKTSVLNTISILSSQYKELSRDELVSYCAKLNESIHLYQLLSGINKKIEELDELFKEE